MFYTRAVSCFCDICSKISTYHVIPVLGTISGGKFETVLYRRKHRLSSVSPCGVMSYAIIRTEAACPTELESLYFPLTSPQSSHLAFRLARFLQGYNHLLAHGPSSFSLHFLPLPGLQVLFPYPTKLFLAIAMPRQSIE